MITSEKLADLRRLAERISPDSCPWWFDDVADCVVSADGVAITDSLGVARGDYIAAADPHTVLELIDEIEMLRGKVEMLQEREMRRVGPQMGGKDNLQEHGGKAVEPSSFTLP